MQRETCLYNSLFARASIEIPRRLLRHAIANACDVQLRHRRKAKNEPCHLSSMAVEVGDIIIILLHFFSEVSHALDPVPLRWLQKIADWFSILSKAFHSGLLEVRMIETDTSIQDSDFDDSITLRILKFFFISLRKVFQILRFLYWGWAGIK